jgi:cytochrome c oxidase subunit II
MHSPVRRKLLACSWILLAVAFVLTESALAGNGGIAPPEPASPSADRIRDAYWIVLAFTGAIFVLVEGALLLFIVRYRSRGRGREVEGPQVVGHQRLEIIWTVIPVLILVVIASFVFYKLPGVNNTPDANAAGEKIQIKVEGRQFYWRYVYPNGRVAVNELRVPVGRVIELELTAPVHDVIHSWWVPRLAGKKDAIPGEVDTLWFEAEEPGLYEGQCAEYCGAQHALMYASVRAVPQAEYDRWIGGPAAGLGEQTWQGACSPCHGDEGQGLIGPPLAGRAPDPEQIRAIVREGRGAMPAVGKGWDDTQLQALIGYITREFGQGAPSGG